VLPEDKLIRGQVWTQDYFPEGWFRGDNQDEGDEEKEEEEGEEEETENFGQSSICYARKDRVLWLAYRLAHFNIGIQYVATAKEWSCEDPSDIISLDYVVVEIADGSEASFGSLRAVEYKLKSLAISK